MSEAPDPTAYADIVVVMQAYESIYSLFTPTIKRMESNGVDTDS